MTPTCVRNLELFPLPMTLNRETDLKESIILNGNLKVFECIEIHYVKVATLVSRGEKEFRIDYRPLPSCW